jgi:hypothetical protein
VLSDRMRRGKDFLTEMSDHHLDGGGPVAAAPRWQNAVVGGLVVSGIAWVVLAAIGVVVLRNRGPSVTDRAGVRSPDEAGDGFLALLHHWDSGYFLAIASDGYFRPGAFAGLPSFFPAYPVAARSLSEAMTLGHSTPASVVGAMWAISWGSALPGAILLWRLADVTNPGRLAPLATLMFVAGPYSVFLYANYSESLFLLFAVAAWYAGIRGRWLLAGLGCGLATFTRINGIFLLAALLVMYVVYRRRRAEPVLSPIVAWVAVAGSGVAAYFAYLALRTGDLLAWKTAQSIGWHREFHWPWEAFYQTAGRVLFASTTDRRLQFGLDLAFAVLLLWAIAMWVKRRDWAAVVYAGLTVAALTTSLTFVSLARNSLTVFPLVILLTGLMLNPRRPWLRPLVLVPWFGLFLLNGSLFALGFWAD